MAEQSPNPAANETTFDDLSPGQIFEFGSYPVTKDEVVTFARSYDPQPFHMDEKAASAHPIFKGLCASGVHTLAMAQSMMIKGFMSERFAILAGAGMDEVRLHVPVYPGDVLRVVLEMQDLRESRSRPDRGTVTYKTSVVNQHGQPVLTYRSVMVMGRRRNDRTD